MKKLPFLLLIILFACGEDKQTDPQPIEVLDQAPFNKVFLSSGFELPSVSNSQEYLNMTYLDLSCTLLNSPSSTSDPNYNYTSKMSSGLLNLKVTTISDTLTLKFSGAIPRYGSTVPKTYVGKAEQWTNTCDVSITIKLNVKTFRCGLGLMTLKSERFNQKVIFTNFVRFQNTAYNPSTGTGSFNVEWTIQVLDSNNQPYIGISIFDVYGTSFKK